MRCAHSFYFSSSLHLFTLLEKQNRTNKQKRCFRMEENYFSPIFIFANTFFISLQPFFCFASRSLFICLKLISLLGFSFHIFTNLHQLRSSWLIHFFLFFSLFSTSTLLIEWKFLWHNDGHTTSPRMITTNWEKVFLSFPFCTPQHSCFP
jgi:hypothetical protein